MWSEHQHPYPLYSWLQTQHDQLPQASAIRTSPTLMYTHMYPYALNSSFLSCVGCVVPKTRKVVLSSGHYFLSKLQYFLSLTGLISMCQDPTGYILCPKSIAFPMSHFSTAVTRHHNHGYTGGESMIIMEGSMAAGSLVWHMSSNRCFYPYLQVGQEGVWHKQESLKGMES